jgi:ferric-dicitrate binding protein FerR (iron transport regulator)
MKRAVVIVGLAVAGVATTAQAEESIGGARTVVNLVTGDLPTGANVNVFQGDDVFRDEGVRTDAESSARLVLRDNTNLLLGPSSSIKLDRFVYAGPSQPGAIAVNLVKGALRFATGDADKKAYLISTPTAALGVRGTVLKIVSNASKTFVVLDEGGAVVCTRAAAKKHWPAAHRARPRRSGDRNGRQMGFARQRDRLCGDRRDSRRAGARRSDWRARHADARRCDADHRGAQAPAAERRRRLWRSRRGGGRGQSTQL